MKIDHPRILIAIFALTLAWFSLRAVAVCEAGQARNESRESGRGEPAGNDIQSRLRALTGDIATLEQQALAAEKSGQWQPAALAYLKLMNVARRNGDLQKALNAGERALGLWRQAKIADGQILTELSLSHVFRLLNQETKAGEILQSANDALGQVREPVRRRLLEAALWRELGYHYLKIGEAKKAVDYISRALAELEARLVAFSDGRRRPPGGNQRRALATMQHGIVVSLLRLGAAQHGAGNLDGAVKAYEKGLDRSEERRVGKECRL